MSPKELTQKNVSIHVENMGGINETELEASPGVTVLTGRNATNRTSLLRATMAALGSDRVSLKGDADEGHAELIIGDTTYIRTLTRKNGTVTTSGEPYLDDSTVADLFAFLLESNEARHAVARGENLRDLIMRPINTDAIRADIKQRESERRHLDDQLNDLDDLKRKLPDLEDELSGLDSRIEDKHEELENKETELETADRDVDETREEKNELEDKLTELRETRSDLEDVRFDIDTHEESITALREEKNDLKDEYGALPDTPMGDRSELDQQIDQLRDREATIEAELSELQSIVQFNEDMLDGDHEHLTTLNETTSPKSDEVVTDQLLADESMTCWTCGSEVDAQQIESTVERLRELRKETLDEVNSVRDELDDLLAEQSELEDKQRERERLERRLDQIEDEIEDHETTLEDFKEDRERLTDDIDQLEGEVDDLENDEYSEILDLHKEANQLEFELDRLEIDRDDVDAEIADIEDRLEERKQLEDQRAELQEELEELRTRIERIETEAIEEFNEHIETVLDLLDYENIERIWLERVEHEVREGRQKVGKSIFELHIVRTTQSGTAYEDTIEHLSESEREVTGLVFALAGYLVHDLHEIVPVMLLDSLEAVDADRIAALVDYFKEHVDYLLVALLPEDAAALDEDYQRITNI